MKKHALVMPRKYADMNDDDLDRYNGLGRISSVFSAGAGPSGTGTVPCWFSDMPESTKYDIAAASGFAAVVFTSAGAGASVQKPGAGAVKYAFRDLDTFPSCSFFHVLLK